jgi:hypothetical protein
MSGGSGSFPAAKSNAGGNRAQGFQTHALAISLYTFTPLHSHLDTWRWEVAYVS